MPSVKATCIVNASQSVVFDVMTDLPHAADRMSGITSIELLTSGPMGVGTKWKETRKMGGREATETMWITQFVPPSHYVVEAKSYGMHYLTTLRAVELGNDKTRIEFDFNGTPKTFMAKLFTPLGFLFMGMLRKCINQDLADLATAAEAKANEVGVVG